MLVTVVRSGSVSCAATASIPRRSGWRARRSVRCAAATLPPTPSTCVACWMAPGDHTVTWWCSTPPPGWPPLAVPTRWRRESPRRRPRSIPARPPPRCIVWLPSPLLPATAGKPPASRAGAQRAGWRRADQRQHRRPRRRAHCVAAEQAAAKPVGHRAEHGIQDIHCRIVAARTFRACRKFSQVCSPLTPDRPKFVVPPA